MRQSRTERAILSIIGFILGGTLAFTLIILTTNTMIR